MMNNFKKFTAFVLALCMLFSLSVSAFAAEKTPTGYLTWALDDSGTLLVNGAAQSGEILYPTYPRDAENAGGTLAYPYTVPQDCVFLLGDYRTQSRDSRDFGAVPLSDIQGKVISLLRRRTL